MKTLYLLRHAKAEPGIAGGSDLDRPLSERGRAACAAIGAYMQAKNIMPSLVMSSPALRTKETLQYVMKAANKRFSEKTEPKLYLATAEEIMRVVRGQENSLSSVMVVGHNPGMHHAALLYAGAERTEHRVALELKYPTGSFTILHFHCEQWQDVVPGTGELVDFVTPGQL